MFQFIKSMSGVEKDEDDNDKNNCGCGCSIEDNNSLADDKTEDTKEEMKNQVQDKS